MDLLWRRVIRGKARPRSWGAALTLACVLSAVGPPPAFAQSATECLGIKVRMPLQPLDGVAHRGDTVLLVLDQGHADHMPGGSFFPVVLRYGGRLGALEFQTSKPAPADFFKPPGRERTNQ